MPLLTVAEAQQVILTRARPLEVETVDVREARGRVLAEPIHAAWDLPTRDLSVMDGYAVRSEDLLGQSGRIALDLVGESAAGNMFAGTLGQGQCVRIATGAVVPAGADAVIAQEDTTRDGGRVRIDLDRVEALAPGKFVRKAGRELRRTTEVLGAGSVLQAGDLALAGASGHGQIRVHRRPAVRILSTGSELTPLGQMPGPGQIVSTNGFMLALLASEAGADARELDDVADDPARLREGLQAGLLGDVLITSGGISVGDHDLVFDVSSELGCRFDLRGVSLRPGKPLAFGVAGQTLVFALPGNPASAFVTFELFVRPALRKLLGVRGQHTRPIVEVELTSEAVGSPPRPHYLRASLGANGRTATVLPDQMSGNLMSLRQTDALVLVPADVERLPAGAKAQALILNPCSHERSDSSS